MKKNGGKAKGFFTKLKQLSGRRIATETKSKNNSTDNDTASLERTGLPARGKAVLQGRLVTKGFMLAFLFTVVILAGLVWYTWRSNFHLKALETKHFRLLDLSGQIIYFDEVLTMSTEMAAHTGEMEWEDRYRNYEPQLDAAIKEVIELSPEKFMKEAISRTDIANIKLVALENQAFDLVRQGDREQASNLLHSPEYMKQKQVYSNGIKEISNAIGGLEEARLKKEQRIALTITVLLIVTIPLVGFIWFTALGILRRYIFERKRTELALRMSEQRFKAIADYSYFWEVWVSPGGNPIWTNPAVEQVTGYSAKELMAMRDYPGALVYEEDREKVEGAFKSALEGGTGKEMEFRLLRKDGSVVWVETAWQPIFDEKGVSQGHRVSIHDITDRKEAEDALRESEMMNRSLLEGSPVCNKIIDLDFKLRYMSAAGIKRLKIPDIKPYYGQTYPPAFYPEPMRATLIKHLKIAMAGKIASVEAPVHDIEGNEVWYHTTFVPALDDDGRVKYIIATSVDITYRKEAEDALLESEHRFRDFFENAPIGFHIFGPDQVITDINEAELEMIGYSRDAIVGKKTWADLIVPQERDQFKKHWHDITTKGHVRNLEYTLVHKDGRHINVILNASARFDKAGEVVNTRGSVLNITARKQAEQARGKLTLELEAKNKELESILYAASHDLKSPLVNIQGFSYELGQSCELVRSALAGKGKTVDTEKVVEIALNEDIPQALGYILASSAKMDSLLSGLLDISRLDNIAISVKSIDVNAMMANVIEHVKYQITKSGVQLDIKSLPGCVGDISQINRVFTNLLTNALKFLDKSRPGTIHLSGQSRDDHSVYCVEDNGIGIAAEHYEKIFEIFYQLEPDKRKGDGLGLTIAKRITERHNGRIWVESEVGKGSKFFVILPNV